MVLLRSCGPDFCTGRVRDPGQPAPAAEAYARRPEYDAIFNSYKAMRGAQVPVVGVLEGRVMRMREGDSPQRYRPPSA